MKRFLLSALVCLLHLQAFSQIQFFPVQNMEEAKKEAKNQKKLIFVDVYTDWCGPCKWMDKNVFTDQEVGDFFNANFVSIKVDGDPGRGWDDFVAAHKIRSFPTLLAFNSDGVLLQENNGSLEADELLDWAKKVLDPEYQYPSLQEKYNTMMQKYAQKANDAAFRRSLWKVGHAIGAYREYDVARQEAMLDSIFDLLPQKE